MHEILKGRALPCVYTLLIRKKWMLFKLELLLARHKTTEDKAKFFIKIFGNASVPISRKNLLCEFYLYNYMLPKNTKVNPIC